MNFAKGYKSSMGGTKPGGPIEDQEGLNAIKEEGIKRARQDAKNKDIKTVTNALSSGAGPMKTGGFGSGFSLGASPAGSFAESRIASMKSAVSKASTTPIAKNTSTSVNKNLTPYIAMGDKKTNPADFPSYEYDSSTNMYTRKDVANKLTKMPTLDAKPISTNAKSPTLKTLPVDPTADMNRRQVNKAWRQQNNMGIDGKPLSETGVTTDVRNQAINRIKQENKAERQAKRQKASSKITPISEYGVYKFPTGGYSKTKQKKYGDVERIYSQEGKKLGKIVRKEGKGSVYQYADGRKVTGDKYKVTQTRRGKIANDPFKSYKKEYRGLGKEEKGVQKSYYGRRNARQYAKAQIRQDEALAKNPMAKNQ
jgi:hypothetical protein